MTLPPDRQPRWPRFVEVDPVAPTVPPRGVRDPWPRWGWFPREPHTWTFVPGPALSTEPPPAPPEESAAPEEAATPEEGAGAGSPRVEGGRVASRSGELVTVRRVAPSGLVPVRRELALTELIGAARQAAPVAAVVGLVAAAAVAFLRRK